MPAYNFDVISNFYWIYSIVKRKGQPAQNPWNAWADRYRSAVLHHSVPLHDHQKLTKHIGAIQAESQRQSHTIMYVLTG